MHLNPPNSNMLYTIILQTKYNLKTFILYRGILLLKRIVYKTKIAKKEVTIMIYDYEKEGYASLWMAKCADYDILDDYLSTIYLEENEVLEDFFTPYDAKRAFEDELID